MIKSSELVVIIPTRGRPESIRPIAHAWKKSNAKARAIFVIDDDDPALDRYEEQLVAFHHGGFSQLGWWVRPRLRLAGTLNACALELAEHYPLIGFMGDDHRPRTLHWDQRFAECLSGGTGIAYGNDLLVGEKFPTAVFMTSDIVSTLGYMCPPGLVHLCLDLVWRDWGDGIGRITYLGDVIVEHCHPAAQKAAMDATYEECNSQAQVVSDSAAYFDYKLNGLADDIAKLKAVLT